MLTKLLIVLPLLLAPIQLRSQTRVLTPVTQNMKDTAAAELEAVIVDAGKLDDKLAIVNVRAKAAALISLSDPARSEIMFRDVWNFAKEQSDQSFDKEQALTLILKQVFLRNPKLGNKLLNEEPAPPDSSLNSRVAGHDLDLNRKAKLASQLVDKNPRAAFEILERSLSRGITPSGLNALLRLRENNALLSDSVVSKSMDGLRAQSDGVALSGLHLLSVYLFPEGNSVDFNLSLESLQIQYFATTHEVLRASLAKPDATLVKDQLYTKADLQRRAMYQAQMSLTLAALAPRFAPNLVGELNALAQKLGPQLPDNVAQLARLTNARLSGDKTLADNPEMAIPLALQSGNFEEAERLIGELKNEEMRTLYSQLLVKVEARALIASGDVLGALTRIRKVEDGNARLAFYLEALKATEKKKDIALSSLVINEARLLIPQVDRNGLHVRTLLAFASQPATLTSTDEALDILHAAVVAINSLANAPEEAAAKKSLIDLAWAEINDPRSLLDLQEFSQAFSAIGVVDIDRAIIEARKITIKSVQLIARLEAAGEVIRMDARNLKSKPATKAVDNRPRQ